jgi:hypothetical protein
MATLKEKDTQMQSQLKQAESQIQRNSELSNHANFEYLKNIIVKYMETGEHEVSKKGRASFFLICLSVAVSVSVRGLTFVFLLPLSHLYVAFFFFFLSSCCQSLFPVIATVLKLSSQEMQQIKKKRDSKRGLFSFF